MHRALLAIEAPLDPAELRGDLASAGIDVVAESLDAADLVQTAVRCAADLVVAASARPSSALFDAAKMLGTIAPCPFVLFTSDADPARIERASASCVHAYVVDGYGRHRLSSVVQVARARFRHLQVLNDELVGLSRRFEERKLVDRAKGLLMRSRGIVEEEAFDLLRSLAMRARQRIGVVAQGVIDRSRAGEAVNRAGQLRMLSQRLVLCDARAVAGIRAAQADQIRGDCIARIDANFGIVRKAIVARGYGELVDRTTASWETLRAASAGPADRSRLVRVDERAEAMLADAEALTDFLDASGLVANLHVINVSGRQRMLCQRIAKLSFLFALDVPMADASRFETATTAFQAGLDELHRMPLSSAAIHETLAAVDDHWARLRGVLAGSGEPEALRRMADTSERLLDASERLTELYEQAMQMLIGDGLGRMR